MSLTNRVSHKGKTENNEVSIMKYHSFYIIFTFEGLDHNKIIDSTVAINIGAALCDIEHAYGEKPVLVGYKQNEVVA